MTPLRLSRRWSALLCAAAGLLASRCSCGSAVENDEELLDDNQLLQVDEDEVSRLRVFHVALWEVAGDVDVNGRLDEKDVALARKLVSQPQKKVPCAEVADLNYDGVVDQQDVALLERVTANGGPSALTLIPPGNDCRRRGTDIATRHGSPGDHVPLLFFGKFGLSPPASVRVLLGPGTLRRSDAQLHWVDVDPAAPPGSRIEFEISTSHQVYLLALNVVDRELVASTQNARLAVDAGGDGGGGGTDAGVADAGLDGGEDGGTGGGTDAGVDGGVDAGQDAGTDGGTDGGMDGGTDGGTCPQRRKGCDALLIELKYEMVHARARRHGTAPQGNRLRDARL
jgi:Dockerin type I domain